MDYSNQEEDKALEDLLLKVKFNKSIDDLYYSMDEGSLLLDIEDDIKEKESILINILIDSSHDPDNIFKKIGLKNIEELNKKMAEDRIFKRVIKLLLEKNLKWEFRQNKMVDKSTKGYILQLNIYK